MRFLEVWGFWEMIEVRRYHRNVFTYRRRLEATINREYHEDAMHEQRCEQRGPAFVKDLSSDMAKR